MIADGKEVDTTDTGKETGAEVTDFGSSFNEAAEGKSPVDETAETDLEKGKGAVETEEKTAEEKQAEIDAAKLKETGAEKEVDYKHKFETLQGMYAKDVGDLQEKVKTLETKAPTKEQSPEKKEEEDLEIVSKLLEGDDDIKEFLDEYDYLGKPLLKILGKIVKSKTSNGPMDQEAMNNAVAVAVHYSVIKAAHADYDDIIKGADGKPSELQTFVETYAGEDKAEIENAYTRGNAQEVVGLINRYKQSKGIGTVDEIKQRREKKLNDLAVVDRKNGAINANAKGKATSFSDGFAEVADKK